MKLLRNSSTAKFNKRLDRGIRLLLLCLLGLCLAACQPPEMASTVEAPAIGMPESAIQPGNELQQEDPAPTAGGVSTPLPELMEESPTATLELTPSPRPTVEIVWEDDNGEPENVDWGEELTLDSFVDLAKSGQVMEIQWHVMPNVIRALTLDGTIYHFANANQGVDIASVLEDAGVRLGKEGITFRYSFCN